MSTDPKSTLDLSRFKKSPSPSASGSPKPSPASATPPGGTGVPRAGVVDKERRTKAILASIDTLPSLPSMIIEVLRLANDPSANAADFEELISRDQTLTARVLKLVNSPFFALRTPVATISQAIVVLGMKTLRSVVLAANTSSLLDRQLGPYGLEKGGLWMHSMAVATLARHLASQLRMESQREESCLVVGLLHDVGKILLAPHVAKNQAEFEKARLEAAAGSGGSADVVAAELEVLGISHAQAGGKMGEKWELPDELREGIARHHDEFAEDEPAEVTLVRLANDFANELGVGMCADATEPSPDRNRWAAALGLEMNEALLAEVRDQVEKLEPIFEEMNR